MNALRRGAWSLENHAKISRMLRRPVDAEAPPIAAFDCDDTLLCRDTSYATLHHVEAHPELPLRAAGQPLRAMYDAALVAHGRRVAYPLIPRFFAGEDAATVDVLAAGWIQEFLSRGALFVRPEFVDLIGLLQTAGWTVTIVSASPRFLILPIARRLGIGASDVIAMDLSVDADGRYTTTLVEPVPMLEGKADAVVARYGRAATFATGDSRSDAAMMAAAEHALLVDGHDEPLRRDAEAAGWWVQSGWPHSPAEAGLGAHP
jgi:HAD superfamily phosphoserine phosphatase-like hydrolase